MGVCAGNPPRDDIQLGDLLVPFTITLDSGKQHGDKSQDKAETVPLDPTSQNVSDNCCTNDRRRREVGKIHPR